MQPNNTETNTNTPSETDTSAAEMARNFQLRFFDKLVAEGEAMRELQRTDPEAYRADEITCAYAAEKGHLAVLQWLRSQGCPWNKAECLEKAEENGHTATAAWIREQPE